MDKIEIINKETKFNHSMYYRKNKGSINVNRNVIDLLYSFSSKLKDLGEGTFDLNNIESIFIKTKEEQKAKIRTLKKEEASGFALVGSLTLIGTIIISIIIFIIVGKIIM